MKTAGKRRLAIQADPVDIMEVEPAAPKPPTETLCPSDHGGARRHHGPQ